jgi:small-conductance mechanosensitive channel
MTKPRLGIAILSGIVAIAAAVIGFKYGGYIHRHATKTNSFKTQKIAAWAAAGGFVMFGSYSVRRLANQLGRAISKADRSAASIVRLLVTIAGVIVVVIITLSMLRIDVSQLLLGGAITGVIIGIAAQQSLGNMFAGIVLLVAHPFRAGDHVRVKTGSLGGPFEGHVVSMGLTYVVFSTEEGTTMVPNITLLTSGIVRNPLPLPDATSAAEQPPAPDDPGEERPVAGESPEANVSQAEPVGAASEPSATVAQKPPRAS